MDPASNVRMAGYLEKRGKLKLMGSWKKYWFVLEGQLLLYYKSQLEYINLSACRGSLNIGLASCVRPGQGLTIQVVTRTQCTTLRTKERALQEQWLQALLDSMALPNTSSLKRQSAAPQHFRYSLDNLPAINESEEASNKESEKKTTLPRRVSRGDSMLFRIRRMGGMSYGGNGEGIVVGTTRMKAVDKVFNGKFKSLSPANMDVYKKTSEDSQDREGNDLASLSDAEEMTEEEHQSKEKFRNNLETIRDLLEQTNRVSEETSSRRSNESDSKDVSEEIVETQELVKPVNMNPVEEDTSKTSNEEQDSSTESTEQSLASESIPQTEERTEILITAQIHDENQNSHSLPVNKHNQYREITKEKTKNEKEVEEEEEEYYSCYDRQALMQNLLIDIEPTLPPRPEHEIYTSVPQELDLVEYNEVKTEKKHVLRDKIHQLLKKTPSKEAKEVKDEKESHADSEQPKKLKKKRSHSFLKALGFRAKKKERKPTTTCEEESDGEPEYESVDYMIQAAQRQLLQQQREEEEQQQQLQLQELLPINAMLELKHKLRGKSVENLHSDEESEIYEAILGLGAEERRSSINSSQIEEKSITTSTSSQSSANHTYACHNKVKKTKQPSLSLVIPSLPPRRAQRPPSPWHDVPTNNSPVYGNGNFSLDPSVSPTRDGTATSEAPFYLVHPGNNPKAHPNFPIVPDEILNTPEGFLYIQNQWRQAEQNREWNREQQMVAFPSKGRSKLPETLGREKVDINGNADDLQSIDNDSLSNKIGSERLSNLSNCDEESQPDSLEKNVILECEEQKNVVNCSKDDILVLDDEVLPKGNVIIDTDHDSDVELRVQSKNENYSDTSSPVQQDKCLEFQLVDFSSNGNIHDMADLSTSGLHTHGILSNQAHNLEIMRINRYSDELHQLLAQLAEITSAPLFNAGATKSLITQTTTRQPTLDEELGPIRRRRHSDPDYDIPRPHGSLQLTVRDTPDPSISPDSLEPNMEGKYFLKDLC